MPVDARKQGADCGRSDLDVRAPVRAIREDGLTGCGASAQRVAREESAVENLAAAAFIGVVGIAMIAWSLMPHYQRLDRKAVIERLDRIVGTHE